MIRGDSISLGAISDRAIKPDSPLLLVVLIIIKEIIELNRRIFCVRERYVDAGVKERFDRRLVLVAFVRLVSFLVRLDFRVVHQSNRNKKLIFDLLDGNVDVDAPVLIDDNIALTIPSDKELECFDRIEIRNLGLFSNDIGVAILVLVE